MSPGDAAGPIELRIHGVSGSPADRILGGPTRLESGDARSGFHRLIAEPDGPLEAYSWGGMTSGSRWSALWVLMLPFAVVNVAGWMARRRPTGAHVVSVRLFGLAMSGIYGLASVALFVDLGAYRRTWGGWGWVGGPHAAGLVAGVLAIALPVATAILAGRSRQRYEARGSPRGPAVDPTRWARMGEGPGLWNAPRVVEALGLLHLTFTVGCISVVMGHAGLELDGSTAWPAWGALLGGTALVGVSVVATALHVARPELTDRLAHLNESMIWWLATGGVAGLGVAATALALPESVTPMTPALPGLDLGFGLLISALLLIWGAHAIGIRRGGVGRSAPSTTFLVIGAGLLLSFAAGTARLASGRRYPEAFVVDHLALAFAVTLVGIAGAAAIVWLWARRPRTRAEAGEAASVSVRTGLVRLRRAATRIAALFPVAALLPIGWPFLLTLLGSRCPDASVPAVFTCPAQEVFGPMSFPGTTGGLVFDIAAWIAVAGPVLALVLYLARGAWSLSLRRRVGVAWDLMTFWPRWYHPWAPPPYPEVAVVDLAERIVEMGGGRRVIVSAHSQGSVLALPALLQAGEATDVIIHGSPIERFYGAFFPTQVDQTLITEVATTIEPGRWVNLYRATDPIGGPLGTDGVTDILVAEPLPDGRVAGHSDYEEAPEYRETVARFS